MAQPKYNAGDTVIYRPNDDPETVVVELVLGTFKQRGPYYATAKFHYAPGPQEPHFTDIEVQSCQVRHFDSNTTERLEHTERYRALLELGATPKEAITRIPNLKAAIRKHFQDIEKKRRSLEFELKKLKGMLDTAQGFLETDTLLDDGVAYGAVEWEDVKITAEEEAQDDKTYTRG